MRFSRVRRLFTTHLGHLGVESSAYQRTLLYVDTLRPRLRATPERSQLHPPAADQNPLSIAKRRASEREEGARFNLEARGAVCAGVFLSGLQVYRESAARFNNNRVLSATETSFLINQIRRLGAATNLIGANDAIFAPSAPRFSLNRFHIGDFHIFSHFLDNIPVYKILYKINI